MDTEEEKRIEEEAALYQARLHEPVVIRQDEHEVIVKMTVEDYRAFEKWLEDRREAVSGASREEEAREQRQRAMLASEIEAYRQMLPELLKTHKGKWVAVHGGQLIDSDESQTALNERVLSVPDPLYIGFVQEEHPRRIEVWSPLEFRRVSL